MDRDEIRIVFSRRQLKAGLALGSLLSLGYALRSVETMRLSTYYPAPAGVYKKIITTAQTLLARDSGRVGIRTGTRTPTAQVDIQGEGTLRIWNTQIWENEINRYGTNPDGTPNSLKNLFIQYRDASLAPSGIGTPGNTIINLNGGRVGIGVENPMQKLDVAGDVKVGNSGVACSASLEGSQRYNYSTKRMEFCNGSVWTTGWALTTTVEASVSADSVVNCAAPNDFPQNASKSCPPGTTLDFAFLSRNNVAAHVTGPVHVPWHYCSCSTSGNTVTVHMCDSVNNPNVGCSCTAVCHY